MRPTPRLLAGHWRPVASGTAAGTGGPAAAAGQASVVSGEAASGARAVVFGTSVFFRTHPKGQMGQVGRTVLAASGEAGDAATSVTLTSDGPRRYPDDVVLRVAVSDPDGTPTGDVVVRDAAGATVGSATLADGGAGSATVTLRGVRPGTGRYTATYTPDAAGTGFTAATSAPVPVTVRRAVATTTLRVVRLGGGRVRLVVGLDTAGAPRTGTVVVRDRGARRQVVRFDGDTTERRVVRLTRGRHVLRATYAGTALAAPDASPRVPVTIG